MAWLTDFLKTYFFYIDHRLRLNVNAGLTPIITNGLDIRIRACVFCIYLMASYVLLNYFKGWHPLNANMVVTLSIHAPI